MPRRSIKDLTLDCYFVTRIFIPGPTLCRHFLRPVLHPQISFAQAYKRPLRRSPPTNAEHHVVYDVVCVVVAEVEVEIVVSQRFQHCILGRLTLFV
jgi:hypothetical protein